MQYSSALTPPGEAEIDVGENPFERARAHPRPPTGRRYAGGMHVEVQVDDVVAEHKRLADRGVEVGELSTKPWGECRFSFSDPDGYLWSYGQPSPTTEESGAGS